MGYSQRLNGSQLASGRFIVRGAIGFSESLGKYALRRGDDQTRDLGPCVGEHLLVLELN
jgi:hypothetical protein